MGGDNLEMLWYSLLKSESDGTPFGIPTQHCSDISEQISKCSRISCGIHRRG